MGLSNTELENAVLGALLLEKNAFDEVAMILTADTFEDKFNKVVFTTIAALKKENKPADMLLVAERLKTILPPEEGATYKVANLTSHVASAAHLVAHAYELKALQAKREIVSTAQSILKKAEEGAESDELMDLLKSKVETLEDNSIVNGPVRLVDAVKQVLEDLKKPESPGLTTGFPTLDLHFGGLRAGRVYVCAGRPGSGKTSVALFAAWENVKQGKKVLFFTAEQDAPDLAKKLLAAEMNQGHGQLDAGKKPTAQDWQNIDEAVAKLEFAAGELKIKDWPKNIQEVAATIRNEKRKNGLDLAVIDYLQLIPGMKKSTFREAEVSEVSRAIKQIAMTAKIPIIALAQLNRQGIGEPQLHHLRESGSIEQDADVVMFVHRPALDEDSKGASLDYGKIFIRKNRRGRTGEIEFYNKDMSRFSEQPILEQPLDRPF